MKLPSIRVSAPIIFASAMLLISVSSCTYVPPSDPQEANEQIREASRRFSDAFVRNDTQALAEIYAEDAILLPHGREIRGREDASRFFAWRPGQKQIAHSMASSTLDVRGDTAIDVGVWHSTVQRGDSPASSSSGTYLVVWTRERDGRWRIKYDIWHPPASAK